jgi:hypothetical protein
MNWFEEPIVRFWDSHRADKNGAVTRRMHNS